jgi:hypothetical protein
VRCKLAQLFRREGHPRALGAPQAARAASWPRTVWRVDLAAALLTVVAAVIAFRQIRRDARKATAIDPGWRAPWQIAGEAARRRLRRRVGRVRAWLRRLFRRQIPTVYGSAQDALGRGDAFNARGIVGESTSVEFRVGVLEHRVEDLGAKVERQIGPTSPRSP